MSIEDLDFDSYQEEQFEDYSLMEAYREDDRERKITFLENKLKESGYVKYEEIAECLVDNKPIPSDVINELLKSSDSFILGNVLSHHQCPVHVLEKFLKERENESSWLYVKLSIARNPSCPEYLLREIAKDDKCVIDVLFNRSCSSKLLEEISELHLNSDSIKNLVVSHPNCPSDLLEKLADKDKFFYPKIIEHVNCPISIIENLNVSELDFNAQRALISRLEKGLECPKSILKELSNSSHSIIRCLLASYSNLPEQLFEKLSSDSSFEVKTVLAENPKCPTFILERFLEDGLEEKPFGFISAILQNPNCPSTMLAKFSTDQNYRTEVAKNEKCPSEILDKLSRFSDCEFIVANNINTSESTLEFLMLNSSNRNVISSILDRENVSINVLECGLKGKNREYVLQKINSMIHRKKVLDKILLDREL
ncbi:MAG: hypothetical protein QXX30_03525 [Candidatus Aenigmatarchaeota archaeon]